MAVHTQMIFISFVKIPPSITAHVRSFKSKKTLAPSSFERPSFNRLLSPPELLSNQAGTGSTPRSPAAQCRRLLVVQNPRAIDAQLDSVITHFVSRQKCSRPKNYILLFIFLFLNQLVLPSFPRNVAFFNSRIDD